MSYTLAMQYNFSSFKEKTKSIYEWLHKEYATLRTGQASPALLDGIMVESYGSKSPLSQVGSVLGIDSKTLKISPWDSSQIKEVEKAILTSGLGVTPRLDETSVYITFPPLTAERRHELVKVAKDKLEDAKISIRNERERVLKDIQSNEKIGKMTEDDVRKARLELQKIVDESNKALEGQLDKKEIEILS